MTISTWINEVFYFCQTHPFIAGIILVALLAMIWFRPKAVGRLALISLAIFVLIYIGSYIGKASSTGVQTKTHMMTDTIKE